MFNIIQFIEALTYFITICDTIIIEAYLLLLGIVS